MVEHGVVPQSVALVYRVVGNTHVFSSKGIRGLVSIGHHDCEKAFDGAIQALGKHVSQAYGCEAVYKCDMTYDEFASHLAAPNNISAGVLEVTLDMAA